MSRIRSIHPGFFTDEAFVQLSAFARLLLLGLGIEADDKGTFLWKPITLKMRIFPMDPVDIQELLAELVKVDAIRRYKVDGREYAAIRNFRQHQRPKKPNDLNPLPDEFYTYVGLTDGGSEPVGNQFGKSLADGGEDGEEGRMEDGGEDGEEGESSAHTRTRATRATKLPQGFEPILTPHAQGIVDPWPPGLLEAQLSKFKDDAMAKGKIFKDWQAAFRTWIANAEEWRNERGGNYRNGSAKGSGSGDGFIDAIREHRDRTPPR